MIRQEPYFCQFELCKYIYWPLEQYLSDKIKRTASNADLVKSSKKDIHHDLWSDLRRSGICSMIKKSSTRKNTVTCKIIHGVLFHIVIATPPQKFRSSFVLLEKENTPFIIGQLAHSMSLKQPNP